MNMSGEQAIPDNQEAESDHGVILEFGDNKKAPAGLLTIKQSSREKHRVQAQSAFSLSLPARFLNTLFRSTVAFFNISSLICV